MVIEGLSGSGSLPLPLGGGPAQGPQAGTARQADIFHVSLLPAGSSHRRREAQAASAAIETVYIAGWFPLTCVVLFSPLFKRQSRFTTISFFTASILSEAHPQEFC